MSGAYKAVEINFKNIFHVNRSCTVDRRGTVNEGT